MIEERKATLEENKIIIPANAREAKMLTLNTDSLNVDARMIMQSVRYQMLQLQKDQLTAKESEDIEEMDAEAIYADAAATP
ncbi:hypothetical protein ZWY2020_018914 [Hordeum vulgare]|nr:hypothetical protein ZWY2020_018914 [Hordeum vulgare]